MIKNGWQAELYPDLGATAVSKQNPPQKEPVANRETLVGTGLPPRNTSNNLQMSMRSGCAERRQSCSSLLAGCLQEPFLCPLLEEAKALVPSGGLCPFWKDGGRPRHHHGPSPPLVFAFHLGPKAALGGGLHATDLAPAAAWDSRAARLREIQDIP